MEEKNLGRPRTHDRDKIARDIIEWAKKEDSINVNKFCAFYDPPFPCRKLSEWSRECDKFRSSYEIAKNFLAFRREEWLSNETLHVKAYDLTAPAYDFVIKEEKQEQAKYESSLKKENEKAPDKVVFEVNYNGRAEDQIEIHSKTLSNKDSP